MRVNGGAHDSILSETWIDNGCKKEHGGRLECEMALIASSKTEGLDCRAAIGALGHESAVTCRDQRRSRADANEPGAVC